MTRAIVVFAFAMFGALAGRLNAQPSAHPFIQQYATAFEKALQQHNPALLSPYHAERIRLMPPFQKTMKGRTPVSSYYQALSRRFIVSSVRFNTRHLFTIDTVLVDQGNIEIHVGASGGGAQHTLVGNYVHLWTIRNPAKPLLLTDVWNLKQLPFDNEQLRFRELPTVDVALMAHLPVNSDLTFELAALNRLMEATVAQHDAVAWALFYADDSYLLVNNGDYHTGKDAIRRYLTEHAPELPVFEKLDIRNDEIKDLGDGYVLEYASHVANWRSDENSGIGLGKDFRIWKRQRNGSLKILTHIGSYD